MANEEFISLGGLKNPQGREQLLQERSKVMQNGMHMVQCKMGGHGMVGADVKDGNLMAT